MLTHFRYTVKPPILDEIKAIKNHIELEGLRNAYLKDGASYVRAQVESSSGDVLICDHVLRCAGSRGWTRSTRKATRFRSTKLHIG
jgi:hypothetical protein